MYKRRLLYGLYLPLFYVNPMLNRCNWYDSTVFEQSASFNSSCEALALVECQLYKFAVFSILSSVSHCFKDRGKRMMASSVYCWGKSALVLISPLFHHKLMQKPWEGAHTSICCTNSKGCSKWSQKVDWLNKECTAVKLKYRKRRANIPYCTTGIALTLEHKMLNSKHAWCPPIV